AGAGPPADAAHGAPGRGPDAQPDGAGGGQSVHGGSRPTFDRPGDGEQVDRVRGDVSLVGAERDAGAAGGALDAVDGAAAGRDGAGHGDGDVSDRQQDGVGYGEHPGDA